MLVASSFYGCSGATGRLQPTPSSLDTSSVASFTISAANSYNLSGPYQFETSFSDMAGFNSPTISGSAPDGSFVFNPPRNGSTGGRIQILFRNLNASLRFACRVGDRVIADVHVTDSNSEQSRSTISPIIQNGSYVLNFSTHEVRGPVDLSVIITAPNQTREWNLERCNVVPNF
jgi:hypothetical protein